MVLEALLLLLGGLGIYEGVRLTKTTLLYADAVGPGWYLLLMSFLLLACGIALVLRRLVGRLGPAGDVGILLHQGAAGRAFLVLVLYGIALTHLGYVVSSLAFFTLVQRTFGERSWVRCAVIGASITAGFYVIFSYLAAVPLP
jgi:hypothetical protein